MKEFKVTIPEYGRYVYALHGTTIFECLARAGVLVRTPCGGQGVCGKCKIKVVAGNLAPSSDCRKFFSPEEIDKGFRLACKAKLSEDISVEIPRESLFDRELFYLGMDEDQSISMVNPAVKKIYFELPPPTLENPISDLENLRGIVGDVKVDLEMLRKLPVFLRKNNFCGTAVISGNRLVALERKNTMSMNFAVSVDLGTTSIVIAILDVHKGKIIASAGMLNPQAKFGDDVITRISAQSVSKKNLEEIRRAAVDGINGLVDKLCSENKVSRNKIYFISLAGNTVMELLLCGIPAEQLGVIPFASPFKKGIFLNAKDLGFKINPAAALYLFPVIGGFVGGDIVSGLVSSEIAKIEGRTLFVDVGTNGEIVFSDNGKYYGGAAAAGPAFEGARIESGMRASRGAIEKILLEDGDLSFNVIRNVEPIGMCGTALIDIVAELLRCGVIDVTGRILPPEELPPELSSKIRNRVIPDKSGSFCDFLITESGGGGRGIYLRQKDVRELQLASGAISAAIKVILKRVGVEPGQIDLILIAGAFGNFIRRKNAKRIGLIPDIPDSKILYIGNASAAGAAAVIMSSVKIAEAEEIAEAVKYIEISQDPEFQDEFAMAMLFPESCGDC